MKHRILCAVLLAALCWGLPAHAKDCPDFEACMEEAVRSAGDDVTIGELRQKCGCEDASTAPARVDVSGETGKAEKREGRDRSAIDERLEDEKKAEKIFFALTPHRRNYLMPVLYNASPNESVYTHLPPEDRDLDNVEIKFQFSIKYRLFHGLFGDTGDFYFAYTNLSYWQAYNFDNSSPFRDTDHEPEVWLQFDTEWELGPITHKLLQIGAVHQSNGRSEPFSRSWNRLYLQTVFETGDFYFALKPWFRVPEDDDEDDNPDIQRFMGYGEFNSLYRLGDHNFTFMLRNNLRASDNKGAVELGWTFPLYKKLRGYIQYFNGYGQTLLDYDHGAETIGIGIELLDLL